MRSELTIRPVIEKIAMFVFPKEKQIAQTLHFHHLLQGFLRQVGFSRLLRDIVSSRKITSGTSVLYYVPPLSQTHNNPTK